MIGRNSEFVIFGPFRFAPGDGLWRDGRPVAMPPRAVGVLAALLAAPGTIVSKQELMDAVWPGTFVTESSLLEAIGLVRDALGDDRRNPKYIQTVHRRGYRFIGNIEPTTLQPRTQPLEPLERLEPLEPLPLDFSEPLRPILLACATYAVTTVCVAIVFAIFGQQPIQRVDVASVPSAAPRLAVSHAWPSWTPEGIEIAFAFSKAGPFHTESTWDQLPTSISPDGRLMAFSEAHPMSGTDIWLFDLRTRTRRVLVRSWSDETFARFSPDGRSIAYMSNVSGRWEVYVQPLSGGTPSRVSNGGGLWPSWSNDGETVYFTSGERAHARADLRVVLDWFSELARVRPS